MLNPVASSMILNLRTLGLVLLSVCPAIAASMSVSPSLSTNGSYAVSWSYPHGCTYGGPPGWPTYDCYILRERVDSGQWYAVQPQPANYATSWSTSGKAEGTYDYKIEHSYGDYYGGTTVDVEGPVTVSVCYAPSFSINNKSKSEGLTLTFTVSKSGSTGCSHNVSYYTANSTATAGSDYNSKSGTLTFSSSQTSKTVSITSIEESVYENNEKFYVYLHNATNGATISDNRGDGTITNDDSPPSFSINNKSSSEGNNLTFTVTKAGSSQLSHNVSYATQNNTASSGSDYSYKSGTLSFSSSQTTRTFTVTGLEDTIYENNETFYANLSNPTSSATISDGQGVGTITNDDSAPSFSINNKTISEGGTLSFSVTKSGSTALSHNVSYATAAGTASTSDYTTKSGALTFTSSQTSKTVSVPTTEESTYENTERMYVNLSSATSGATISDSQGWGDITNDDSAPVFSIDNVTVTEGGSLVFDVDKSGSTALTHTVDYATANGSAVSGSDFTSVSGTLSFSSSQSTKTVTVNTVNDGVLEPSESLYVNLSNPSNSATLGASQGTGTVNDAISVSDSSGVFTINPPTSDLPGATPGSFSVDFTGSANYQVPIAVPPGTAGMQPELALAYNSANANSFVGLGWTVTGLSAISRCARTEAQDSAIDSIDYDSGDRFCLDGQRLVAVSGTYGANGTEYRTEINQFAKVVSYGTAGSGPQYFRAWTKPGRVVDYGNTSDSRIEAVGQSSVRVWAVNKIADTADNYMTVSYSEDTTNGDFRPDGIEYTMNSGGGVTTAFASVDFLYENRPDAQLQGLYQGGSPLTNTRKRLTNITTYDGATLVRDYELDYDEDGLNDASRLVSVTECPASGPCLPAITFDWWGTGATPNLTASTLSWPSGGNVSSYKPVYGDWDGNGRTDVFLQAESNGMSVLYTADEDGDQVATGFTVDGWSEVEGWDLNRILTGDFNADGRTDIGVYLLDYLGQEEIFGEVYFIYDLYFTVFHSDLDNGDVVMTESEGSPFVIGSYAWAPEVPFLTAGDFNGDGRTDLRANSGYGPSLVLADEDGEFTEWTGTSAPAGASASGDFNGDARTDVLILDGGTWKAHLSSGTDFDSPASSGHIAPSGTFEPTIADFNADGLDDVFMRNTTTSGTSYVYLSKGDGAFTQEYSSSGFETLYVGDWNNDGRADIAYHTSGGSTLYFYVSTGDVSGSSTLFTSLTTKSWANSIGSSLFSGDWNGDGVTDLWNRQESTDAAYTSTNGGFDLIDTITNSLGTTTEINYAPMTDDSVYTKGALESHPSVTVQTTRHLVESVSVDDGDGGTRVTEYDYEHAVVDLDRRASMGFGKFTVTDTRSDIQEMTSYDEQEFPFVGLPTETERLYVGGANDILLQKHVFTLDHTLSGGVYFPHVDQVISRSYELNETLVAKTKTTNSFDGYGNATSATTEIFETEAQSTAPFKTVTTNTFNNDTSNWFIGQLLCQATQSQASGETTLTRTVGFEYNSEGLVSKEVLEPTDSMQMQCETAVSNPDPEITLITTNYYDDFGNLTTITIDDLDAGTSARTTTIAYGELNGGTTITETNGRFAVKVTNVKGHVGYRQFDSRFGSIIRTQDPNGVETEWDLDALGRPTAEYRDDGSQTNIYRNWCTAGTCPDGGSLKVVNAANGAPPTAMVTDFLGRDVTTSQLGLDGTAILSSTEYDNEGLVDRTSRPYFYGATKHWVSFDYDALGRVTTETAPGEGSTTIETDTVYLPLEIRVTNENGQNTRQYLNVRGETIEVINGYGTSDVSNTEYTYDAFGNLRLVEVDDDSDTKIINTFDIRGRKLTMIDPDTGDWTYEYNAFGELVEQTDDKSPPQVTTFDYDVLGRLIERDENEGTTYFTFDTATNGKGRIASSSAAEGEAKSYAYDSLGRLDAVTTTIDSTNYVLGYDYDADGRLGEITYPASTEYPTGLQVAYGYSSTGYLNNVENDATSESFWTLEDLTAEGQWAEVTYGNGVSTEYSYVAETGLIDTIKTSSPSGTDDVQDLDFAFDPLGNLDQRKDFNQTQTTYEDFGYDALNRLTSAEVTIGSNSQGTKSATYDPLGNLKTKSGINGTYTYGAPAGGCSGGPHAVTSADGESFCYDANGNLTDGYNFTAGRDRDLTWTSFNKPATVTEAGQTLTFAYGADRARFKQVNDFTGQTTIYVGGLYEKQTVGSTDIHVHYIYADGEAVAIYKSVSDSTEETLYLHRDHLGTVTELSDDSGSAANVERLAFDAWGQRRDEDWTEASGTIFPSGTPRGFTGHEHLDDVALVHMNGRVYDPDLGRMMSADPYVQLPGDSQSYNRYSYVLNNPTALTDPSGFCVASGPNCPVGGFAGKGLGGSLAGPTPSGGLGIAVITVTTFTGSFSQSFGSGLGGLGSVTCFVSGCNSPWMMHFGESRGGGFWGSLWGMFGSFGGFSTTGYVYYFATTEAPDSSGGNLAMHTTATLEKNVNGSIPAAALEHEGNPNTFAISKVPNGGVVSQEQGAVEQIVPQQDAERRLRAAGIDLDQTFNDPDHAARYILPVINEVTRATGLEIGGFIYQDEQFFRIYSPIYVGTRRQVPQLSTLPQDVDLVAAFHTHPNRLDFSPGDAAWAEGNRLILYMINPRGVISFCVPSASNCISDGTRQEGTPLR